MSGKWVPVSKQQSNESADGSSPSRGGSPTKKPFYPPGITHPPRPAKKKKKYIPTWDDGTAQPTTGSATGDSNGDLRSRGGSDVTSWGAGGGGGGGSNGGDYGGHTPSKSDAETNTNPVVTSEQSTTPRGVPETAQDNGSREHETSPVATKPQGDDGSWEEDNNDAVVAGGRKAAVKGVPPKSVRGAPSASEGSAQDSVFKQAESVGGQSPQEGGGEHHGGFVEDLPSIPPLTSADLQRLLSQNKHSNNNDSGDDGNVDEGADDRVGESANEQNTTQPATLGDVGNRDMIGSRRSRSNYFSPSSGRAEDDEAELNEYMRNKMQLESSTSPKSISKHNDDYTPSRAVNLPFRIGAWFRPPSHHSREDPRNGRVIDLEKHASRRHTNYFITAWQQTCLKYIFPGAFEERIDFMELVAIAILFGSVILNIVMVSINVFGTQVDSEVSSIRVTGNVIFIFELVIVYILFVCLVCVVIHGLIRKRVGTNFVVDVVDLAKSVAAFSVLKSVRVVSVSFIQENLVPRFTHAVSCFDYFKAFLAVAVWLVMVVVTGGAVLIKVSQVYFTGVIPVQEWTLQQVILIIGLVSNLAKVDTSYAAETEALLSAVHKHYCGPGGPDSLNPTEEGLYSKVLTRIGVERPSFEFFESVFEYHFGQLDNKRMQHRRRSASAEEAYRSSKRYRSLKAFNFMAFVLHIDNQSLRRYLQMVDSPLKFYADGRKAFSACVYDRDIPGMEMMLWRSDPEYELTLVRGERFPNTFRLTFTCEDPYVPPNGEAGIELMEDDDKAESAEREILSHALKTRVATAKEEGSDYGGSDAGRGGWLRCCDGDDDGTVVQISPPPTPRRKEPKVDDGIWTPKKQLTRRTPTRSPAGTSNASHSAASTPSVRPKRRGSASVTISENGGRADAPALPNQVQTVQ